MDGITVATSAYVFDSVVYARAKTLSPIALTLDRKQDGTTVTVTVNVKAVADLSAYKDLRLRVAAVEQYVDTVGPNGEKRYMNPLRQLLGGVNGKMLKISAGMDTTYSYTYEVSDVYRPEKMYEIAFVQNDATHEVLQSGSTLESF